MNTVLIAEDEPEIRNYLGLALRCHGYDVEYAEDGEEAVSHLSKSADRISLLLLDLIMPRKDGFETLKTVRHQWPKLPVITVSGSCTPSHVASVMKSGAVDFLAKPIAHDDLLRAVGSALHVAKSEDLWRTENREVFSSGSYISGEGPWAQRVERILTRMGSADVPVLLRGETGVGKEVLARKLHAHSKRADKPFLKINCAALPSELIESELFGYERGAFTGAFRSTPGKFELADRGTILLDEIGDMDFKLQAKLLQVLQDREFLRLGAKDTSRVDVRVMAATHCDLEKAMHEGRFREDLYYRLNIVEISVPPLRERKDEIQSLTEHFFQRYAPVEVLDPPSQLIDVLLHYDWPGNVRELENVIRRYLIFRSVDVIAAELKRKAEASKVFLHAPAHMPTAPHLSRPEPEARSATVPKSNSAPVPEPVRPMRNGPPDDLSAMSSTLAQVEEARKQAEKDTILAALNSTLWNRKKAAKLLNIDYKALLYKMRKLGIGEKLSLDSPELPLV